MKDGRKIKRAINFSVCLFIGGTIIGVVFGFHPTILISARINALAPLGIIFYEIFICKAD